MIYRSARVHARASSISLWQTSWLNQHTISLSVNQSPTPQGGVSLGMVLRVRLLEVGGSTWGALGKAFLPFTFLCGTGAVRGGAKRSTSESDDQTSFFFTSLPRGEANRGLESTSNSLSPDTGFFGEGGGQGLLNVYLLTHTKSHLSVLGWALPRIGHSKVCRQKPHPSQCMHHKYTVLRHWPHTEGGRKRLRQCQVLRCTSMGPAIVVDVDSSSLGGFTATVEPLVSLSVSLPATIFLRLFASALFFFGGGCQFF